MKEGMVCKCNNVWLASSQKYMAGHILCFHCSSWWLSVVPSFSAYPFLQVFLQTGHKVTTLIQRTWKHREIEIWSKIMTIPSAKVQSMDEQWNNEIILQLLLVPHIVRLFHYVFACINILLPVMIPSDDLETMSVVYLEQCCPLWIPQSLLQTWAGLKTLSAVGQPMCYLSQKSQCQLR